MAPVDRPITRSAANLNLDMFLPIVPLRIVRGYGVGESSLAGDLAAAAEELNVAVQDDPEPEAEHLHSKRSI